MFEFSLENGKKQFVGSFLCLILAFVNGLVLAIALPLIKNANWFIAISIIFGAITGAFIILALIKMIFGAVVYHAERTSARDELTIIKDNSSMNKPEEKINLKDYKKISKDNQVPVEKIVYYKKANAASIILKDGRSFRVWNIKDDIKNWQKLSIQFFTKYFYDELIDWAEPEQKRK